jgi:hypothetical protein
MTSTASAGFDPCGEKVHEHRPSSNEAMSTSLLMFLGAKNKIITFELDTPPTTKIHLPHAHALVPNAASLTMTALQESSPLLSARGSKGKKDDGEKVCEVWPE